MTLADRLRERIKRDGPITFHDWMEAALYDDRDGYYRRAHTPRQGRLGDYRTAPETSPLFGATFASYFAGCYQELGAPQQWTILEAGAGRGDFAHAVLTTLRRSFAEVFAATHYIIDELGDETRAAAADKLRDFGDRLEYRSISELTSSFVGIVFSNELLDAFPVHRITGEQGALRELAVEVNDRDEFVWTHGRLDPRLADHCARMNLQLGAGQIYELNLAAGEFVRRAAGLIERGYLVTVDYGAERADLLNDPNRFQGTLRAFHRHQMIEDLLAHPGAHDLTTTVDWTQVQEAGAAQGLDTARFQRLDKFLLEEGLLDRVSDFTADLKSTAEVLSLNAGARELIMPHGLSPYFQVLVQRKIA